MSRTTPARHGSVRWRAHALGAAILAAGCLGGAAVKADNGLLPPPPPPPVDAYSFVGKLAELGEYDSNPLLQPGTARGLYGTVTTPEVTLGADTPSFHLDDDTRVNINRFNLAPLSSDDVHSVSHLTWRGESFQFTTLANLDSDTTRTSEVQASGLNVAGISHHDFALAPQMTWFPDKADMVQLAGSFTGSFYQANPLYQDYRVYGVTPSYQHLFDERNAGLIQLQVSRFQTLDSPGTTIDQVQPAIGWGTSLTEEFVLTGNVGVQRTYWTLPASLGTYPATTGAAFAVDIGYKGTRDTLHITAGRQPNPTGIGTELETTSIAVTNKYQISQRLELDLNCTYQKSDYGPNTVAYQRNFVSANPALLYHLTDQADVSFGYQYRQQGLVTLTQVPASDAVLFTLTYSPTALSLR